MKCHRTGSRVQCLELVAGLLDVVLADVRCAAGDRLADGLRREGLGHRDKAHVGAAAAAGLRCSADARPDAFEACRDGIGHVGLICRPFSAAESQPTTPWPDEVFDHLAHRQPDHVGVGAVDAFDQEGSDALDGVGAGLVERLAGLDVPVDLHLGEGLEPHVGFTPFPQAGCPPARQQMQ